MQDLEKVVELGREFAKPWKQATKVLAGLLLCSIAALLIVALRHNNIVLKADFNSDSEITQTQG
jgi:hypothetical protein